VPRRRTDFAAVLETLRRHRVRFLLVGGVAAVVEGAPVSTFDLDIVAERSPRNVERLLAALQDLGAFYRSRPDRRLPPTAKALRGDGHHLLMTRYGPLDVLGVVGEQRDFMALSSHTRRRKLGQATIQVLDLETQITIKEELGQRKDRLMLPVLRETLRLQRAKAKRKK
jgi:hypothetical protein